MSVSVTCQVTLEDPPRVGLQAEFAARRRGSRLRDEVPWNGLMLTRGITQLRSNAASELLTRTKIAMAVTSHRADVRVWTQIHMVDMGYHLGNFPTEM
jgi:hypothetical protein